MKSLHAHFDKFGFLLSSLILAIWVWEIYNAGLEYWLYVFFDWRVYVLFLTSLVMFRSIGAKFIALLSSCFVLISICSDFKNVSFGLLIHFLANKSVNSYDIFSWVVLAAIAVYSFYSIANYLYVQKKLRFK